MKNPIFVKHAKRFGAEEGQAPSRLKEEYRQQDLFDKFMKSRVVKELTKIYRDDKFNLNFITQLIYLSFITNQTSTPFEGNYRYDIATFSRDCVAKIGEGFPKIFKQPFTKMRLNTFDFGSRYVHIEPRFNKSLNTLVYPQVTIIQSLVTKGDMDSALAKLSGYLYRKFPDPLAKVKSTVGVKSAFSIPIYQWYYGGKFNGIAVYFKRTGPDVVSMRLEFEIPFLLPIGVHDFRAFTAYMKRMINRFSFGV